MDLEKFQYTQRNTIKGNTLFFINVDKCG